MVDDSLEFATSEYLDLHKKHNRKSLIIGNSTQLTNLPITYAGMAVYATTTGGVFTVDKKYIRNAANSAWVVEPTLIETAEVQTTPPVFGANEPMVTGTRYYQFYTLPTTEKYYMLTGIQITSNAFGGAGTTCVMGCDLVDAIPPVNTHTPLIALTRPQLVVGDPLRISLLMSRPIRGGTKIAPWFAYDNTNLTIPASTSGTGYSKTVGAFNPTPEYADNTAWTTTALREWRVSVWYVGWK